MKFEISDFQENSFVSILGYDRIRNFTTLTWSAKDFIDTNLDLSNRHCFEEIECLDDDCNPSSECKLQIEENLENVFSPNETDFCLISNYQIDVKDKDTNQIFCMGNHNCPDQSYKKYKKIIIKQKRNLGGQKKSTSKSCSKKYFLPHTIF